MADNEKKIKEIDDAIRIAENPLNIAPGGEIAGRGYVIDRLNEYKELLKEQPGIVRCKDCKHRWERVAEHGVRFMRSDGKCPFEAIKRDDYYCADAELKGGEQG